MNAKEVVKLVSGSIAVYFIMAACSSSNGPVGLARDGGGGSTGGGSGGGSSGDGSSVLDALTDPVGSAAADPDQSGSRLKANCLAGSDGSKQFMGWHDSMLNVDCNFVRASDGNMHCMPTAGATITYFADAGCSQPLAYVAKGCSPGNDAQYTDTTSNACGPYTVHIYQVGSITTPGTNVYLKGAGGTCTAQPTMYLTEFDFYAVGAELNPSSYVQATMQTEL